MGRVNDAVNPALWNQLASTEVEFLPTLATRSRFYQQW